MHKITQYLQEGLLKKTKKASGEEFFKLAKESILEAERVQTPLWKIVISYYSMFYAANAALLQKGYKVEGKIAHKVTSDTFATLFNGVIDASIIQSLEFERKKRAIFQYRLDSSSHKARANTSLERAKKFLYAVQIVPL